MPKLTIKELGALNQLLSVIPLTDLIGAAGVGFSEMSKTSATSNYAEFETLCDFVAIALKD